MDQKNIPIQKQISETRRTLLDLLEGAMGDHPKWPFIRSRVLKLFGRDGLERLTFMTGNGEVGRNGTAEERLAKIR